MDSHDTDPVIDADELLELARPSILPWVLLGAAVIAGAAGSAYLWTRAGAARIELETEKAALLTNDAEKAELKQRLDKLEAEKADLLALKNELSGQVQARDEELAKLQGTYQELETKMKEEIAKGDVRLSQAGGRIKVDLVDEILFDVGEADVTERGGEVLSRVGAILAAVQDRKIQVSGHTDDLPISDRLRDRYPTNWELAGARANHVVRYLEEKGSVPGRRLVAAAYGPWEPISSNKTPSGRARNRRIEIVLTPALAPAPVDGATAATAAPAPKQAAPPRAAVKPAATKAASAKAVKAAQPASATGRKLRR
jgi:chemotaxis protein MotB